MSLFDFLDFGSIITDFSLRREYQVLLDIGIRFAFMHPKVFLYSCAHIGTAHNDKNYIIYN